MLASACSKYKYETVSGDPLKTRIYTLPNGLKVYMSVHEGGSPASKRPSPCGSACEERPRSRRPVWHTTSNT